MDFFCLPCNRFYFSYYFYTRKMYYTYTHNNIYVFPIDPSPLQTVRISLLDPFWFSGDCVHSQHKVESGNCNVTAAAANRKCVQTTENRVYNLPHLLSSPPTRGRRRESRTRSFSLMFCCANPRKWTAKKNREYNTRGKK